MGAGRPHDSRRDAGATKILLSAYGVHDLSSELCAKGAGVNVTTIISNAKAASQRRPGVTPGHSSTMGCRMPLMRSRIAHSSQPAQK